MNTRSTPETAPPVVLSTYVSMAALVCAAPTAFVVLAFFVIGLGDGSITDFNIVLWLALLSVTAASLIGGISLRVRQKHLAATAALAVLALPGMLAVAFMLMILIAQPRWN